MRLTGATEDQVLDEVWAYLTFDDASDLLRALHMRLLEDEQDGDWHHHVGSPGGPELTISIEP
jgi:hypothetical protein